MKKETTMKKLVLTLALVLSTAAAFGAPSILRKSGDCKLQIGGDLDDGTAFKVELANSDVQITSNLHGEDFFGDFALSANPSVNNKTDKKLSVAYYVAFFDKAGKLIAATGRTAIWIPVRRACSLVHAWPKFQRPSSRRSRPTRSSSMRPSRNQRSEVTWEKDGAESLFLRSG